MVWGAMTAFGVGEIILLEGSVNAEKYMEIINNGVVSTIDQLSQYKQSIMFQDDSAPCHRAKSVSYELLCLHY